MNVVSTLVRFMSVIVSSYENFLPSMVVLFTLPVRGFFLGGSLAAADLGVTLACACVTLVASRVFRLLLLTRDFSSTLSTWGWTGSYGLDSLLGWTSLLLSLLKRFDLKNFLSEGDFRSGSGGLASGDCIVDLLV